jgi:Fe2+ transport system protein B
MEKVLYAVLIGVLYVFYRIIRILLRREGQSFERFLPQEEINRYNFELIHRRLWLGMVSLAISLVYLALLVYFIKSSKTSEYLKRMAKVSDRIVVYTTDGRYGLIFKQPIKR